MHELLPELLELNEEERYVLETRGKVEKDIYTSQVNFVIEGERFLRNNKMIEARKHTRFTYFPKHRHDYIELNYVLSGKFVQTVGSDRLHLQKGELLFLNQHIYHEIEPSEQEDIIINFIINPHFFESMFGYLSSDNNISHFLINSLFDHTQSGQYLYFQIAEVEEIQRLLECLLLEIMRPSLLSESSIKLYTGLLLIELIRHSDKLRQPSDNPLNHYIVVETMKYIDEHYQDASLNELAERLKQPNYSLSKQIKQATSVTFKELLQEKRLERANELLMKTDLPITEIAEMVGYDNISYFYRIFRNKFHMTPKQLRIEMRSN